MGTEVGPRDYNEKGSGKLSGRLRGRKYDEGGGGGKKGRERGRKARPVEGRERVLSTCSRQTGTCPAKWWTWRPLPNHPGSTSLSPIPLGSLFKYLTLYRSPYLSCGRAGFIRRCAHQQMHARTVIDVHLPKFHRRRCKTLFFLLAARLRSGPFTVIRARPCPVNGRVNGKRGRPPGYVQYLPKIFPQ